MRELQSGYEITRQDLAKDKLLKIGGWSAPLVLSLVPASIFLALSLFASPLWLFLTVISLVVGFIFGLIVSGGLMIYRSRWHQKVRERLAVDGIKAEEIDWFKHELTSAEKKSLQEIQVKDLLLADAFRDSLAARLTATRIVKSAKQELSLVKRRQSKLKYSKSDNSANFQKELGSDFEKLTKIQKEAEEMRIEAENRMHQIETAARHGTNFSETDLALKKLSARTSALPLALESARMEQEIRKELEKDD